MTKGIPKCDLTGPDKVTYNTWYRFNGSAGTAMPTKCVDTMRCGAEAPGWLYGGHPKAAEGVANRSVCFHWQHKCCYYKTDIQVKNCRGFFVYKLKRPPMMSLRYCGNGTINQTGEYLVIMTSPISLSSFFLINTNLIIQYTYITSLLCSDSRYEVCKRKRREELCK